MVEMRLVLILQYVLQYGWIKKTLHLIEQGEEIWARTRERGVGESWVIPTDCLLVNNYINNNNTIKYPIISRSLRSKYPIVKPMSVPKLLETNELCLYLRVDP